MANDKIVDRIRKLLALAGNNSQEKEAQAALEKAHALLSEHNLDMTAIESSNDDIVSDNSTVTDSKPWRRPLAVAVARLYFCEALFSFRYDECKTRPCGYIRYDVHRFIGQSHNVAVAKEMFSYLETTISRLAREASKGSRSRSKFEQSFKIACVKRLRERILEIVRNSMSTGSTGSTLPALANLYEQASKMNKEFIESNFHGVVERSPRATVSDTDGAIAGNQAGDVINLSGQIGGEAPSLLK